MKKRRSLDTIIFETRDILKKEKELSIKQISNKTGSQWRTIEKILTLLKKLDIVKERTNPNTRRTERLFSLKTST
jgi:predicted transcriptional regulator